MKRLLLLIALGVAAYLGVTYFADHAGGLPLAQMFIDANIVIKLTGILLNLACIGVVMMGFLSLFDRSGVARKMLNFVTWGAPVLGALAALYSGYRIFAGINAVGGHVDSRVWAPGAAEALLPLVLGFAVAAIAALFLLKKAPEPRSSPA